MTIAETFLPEFDQEMPVTRRLLERVPSDKGQWKPHPKSFALGHLAQLVATMPGWITNILTETSLDLGASPGYSYEKTSTLLSLFDKHVSEARATLAAASDAAFAIVWSLKHGERVLFSAPRVAVVRQTINHLVGHGGAAAGRRRSGRLQARLGDQPVRAGADGRGTHPPRPRRST
jgi:hypothetical protein